MRHSLRRSIGLSTLGWHGTQNPVPTRKCGRAVREWHDRERTLNLSPLGDPNWGSLHLRHRLAVRQRR